MTVARLLSRAVSASLMSVVVCPLLSSLFYPPTNVLRVLSLRRTKFVLGLRSSSFHSQILIVFNESPFQPRTEIDRRRTQARLLLYLRL